MRDSSNSLSNVVCLRLELRELNEQVCRATTAAYRVDVPTNGAIVAEKFWHEPMLAAMRQLRYHRVAKRALAQALHASLPKTMQLSWWDM